MTRRSALRDVALLVSLGAVYVAAEAISIPKRWIIPGVVVALATWFALAGESRRTLGLSLDHLRPAARLSLAFTAVAALAIAGFALATGRPLWRADMAMLLPLYPLYGIVQQAIFQGVLHRRLEFLLGRTPWTLALTAVVFAAVHFPDLALVSATLAAGAAWSAIYRRHPNTLALGISHGILAALAYPLLLGDAPLARM